MKKVVVTFLLFGIFFQYSIAQTKIDEYITKLPENLKVTYLFHSLDNNIELSYQADRVVPSASLIKIPILVVLLEEVAKGKLDLNQLHYLAKEEIVGGAGEIQFSELGKELSLYYLAQEMIRVSDNTATNILIKYLGISEINYRIQDLNLHQTSLQRYMMDFKAIEEGKQNYTSMKDLVNILCKVWKKEVLSDDLRTVFLKMLIDCEDKKLIPSAFINHTSYNKTGTLDYIRGDVAILEGINNFILAIAVEGFDDLSQAEDLIIKLSMMLKNEINF